MLDFADAFGDEAEVRAACGAAAQTDGEMAVKTSRPSSAVQYRSSGANQVGEPVHEKGLLSARASASGLGTGRGVGAATASSATASSIGEWTERIAAGNVVQLGPTFALARSAREEATGGVLAPTWLLAHGITNMLDLAEAFDDEAEVRAASGAAAQTGQDLAVSAWYQRRLRAPTLARRLLSMPASTRSSTTTGTIAHTPPLTPPPRPTPPPPLGIGCMILASSMEEIGCMNCLRSCT